MKRLIEADTHKVLRGDEILLESKIVAVTDVVEAMSSRRPYRPAVGIESALVTIQNGKGTIYDPAVIDACFKLFREERFKFTHDQYYPVKYSLKLFSYNLHIIS